MDKLQQLLEDIHSGKTNIQEGLDILKNFYSTDLGYAKIDHNREARVGYPEIIYGQGKTIEQISGIVDLMYERKTNILITRVNQEVYDVISEKYKEAKYNKSGRVITIRCKPTEETESYIAIVAAGTSDLPVVEEAFETATFFGNKVVKVTDVGVAGIHRLFERIQILRNAKVLIVVAGMEGALPSVIGGLVNKPIIAVPTSIGYGANFGGLSALLAMLNSCSGGISVVNIDNGFGAAYQASMINKL